MSLKIQQLDVEIETKTQDDVFVHIKISVQFQIFKEKVYDAFYKLQSPRQQITAYVFDLVRAEVPKMKLDDVFVKKDDIALAIQRELKVSMLDYGYNIVKALVTDIDPDAQVKEAMNRINAAEREKVAAQFEGDAERIIIVERAKAEAESKRLQGIRQRERDNACIDAYVDPVPADLGQQTAPGLANQQWTSDVGSEYAPCFPQPGEA